MPIDKSLVSVIIVDDNLDNADTIAMITEGLGYKVKKAYRTPAELLAEDQSDVNIAISDRNMPEMEGDELLTKLHGLYPNMRRILMSGRSSAEKCADPVGDLVYDVFWKKPATYEQMERDLERLANE